MLGNICVYGLLAYVIWLIVVESGNGKKVEKSIKRFFLWILIHPISTLCIILVYWIAMVVPYYIDFLNWLYPIWWNIGWSLPIGFIGIKIILWLKNIEEKILMKILRLEKNKK